MGYALLKAAHVLAVLLWVGGMAFAHFFLRPALATLEPQQRLKLMHEVLRRFFAAVLWCLALTTLSGVAMIVGMAHTVAQTGGRFVMPPDWSAMTVVGIVMFAIFGHIRLVLFRRFAAAVQAGTWPQAAVYLALIRQWVLVNLVLGALLIAGVLVF